MKKAISVILAILMLVSVFALAGCGGKEEPADVTGAGTTAAQQDVSQDADQPAEPDAEPDAEPVEGGDAETTTAFPEEPVVPDTLEVVEEIFDYNESHNWIDYLIVVKNVSDEAISVDSRSVCRDADGNFICGNGNVSERIEVLGPGQTSFIALRFSKYPPPPKDAKISYVLETAPSKVHKDVLADLAGEAEVVELDGKKQVSVSVTNNGTLGTQNIFALALCYDANGEYVSFVELQHIQVGDAYGIKPGETGTQTNYNVADDKADYDHVKLFLRAESSFS